MGADLLEKCPQGQLWRECLIVVSLVILSLFLKTFALFYNNNRGAARPPSVHPNYRLMAGRAALLSAVLKALICTIQLFFLFLSWEYTEVSEEIPITSVQSNTLLVTVSSSLLFL